MDRAPRRRRPPAAALGALLICALGILAYWRLPGTDFIGDDSWRIVGMRPYLERGYPDALTEILPDRPLLMAAILASYRVGGLDPRPYKLLSLAFHLAAGLVLFLLLRRLQRTWFASDDTLLPALLAALFVVHPLNSQALVSSIQLGVPMAALGGLASLLLFVEHLASGRKSPLLLSLLSYTLGLLSKSFILTLPLLLLLLLWREGELRRPRLAAVLPYLVLSLLPALPFWLLEANRQAGALPWNEYLAVQTRVVWMYLRLFVLPADLRFAYEIDHGPGLLGHGGWLAAGGHLLLLAAGAWLLRRRSPVGLGILATYLAFLPESGFFPIIHLAFEHRAYYPMAFVAITVLAAVRSARVRAGAAAALLVPAIAACALLTRARVEAVATHEKWALDTYRHLAPGRGNNLFLLNELLVAGADRRGQEEAGKMAQADPGFPPYALFERVFAYRAGAEAERLGTVDLVRRALVDRAASRLDDPTSVNNLLAFLIEAAREHAGSPLAYQEHLEPAYRAQIALFLERPDLFHEKARLHQRTLAQLRGHYERRLDAGALPERDLLRYLNVLGAWTLHDPASLGEIRAAEEKLLGVQPGAAALVEGSRRYYQKLREDLGRRSDPGPRG